MSDPLGRLKDALKDRYAVERELGQGGMATVYLAHDLRHDRQVAIKVLHEDLGFALGAERFLAEIRTTARLQHPRILPLLDSGEAGGLLYYVMPYVTGETLRERLRREPQLGVEETLRIARALAGALDYAHAAGIVHRDLKPENVLFQVNEPVLADFGIALAVKSAGGGRLTETGLSLGTPQYMSPEQASGEREVDVRSDVYALGAVTYEMLAGEPPHTGRTTAAVLMKVLTQPPVPLSVVRSGVPVQVEAAVLKALAKAPADRFESAGAFAAAMSPAPPVSSAAPEKSIVVLPFDNLSPDPNDAYLADGLTEELIADLCRVGALRVISRNSAVAVKQRTRDVKEIARLVDVRYVLEGSVRRAGDNLRITAQLIDGATDSHVWAEKYGGRMDDVFAMQEQVSAAIVAALQMTLSPVESRQLAERPIQNPAAYECYLRARQESYGASLAAIDRSLALLDRALAIEPDNPHLLGHEAFLLYKRYDYRPTADSTMVRDGIALAERALAIDPRCGSAHLGLGMLRCFAPPGIPAGLAHLRMAVEIEPGNIDALFFLAILETFAERLDVAARLAERGADLDPLMPGPQCWTWAMDAFKGRVGAHPLERWSREVTTDGVAGLFYMIFVLVPERRTEELGALSRHWVQLVPGEPFFQTARFLYHAVCGDREAALAAVTPELEDLAWHGVGCWTYWQVQGYALIGETEKAMTRLERAVDLGFVAHDYMARHDPLVESIRFDPRFQLLMARAKAEQSRLLREA